MRFATVLFFVLWIIFTPSHAQPVDQVQTWYEVYPYPTRATLWDVGFNGTAWVAVGTGGSILVSPDAEHWSKAQVPDGSTRTLHGVAFGAGRWVAVGDRGAILSSTDGARWANCAFTATESFAAVAYGKDRFVAIGAYGLAASSTNGQDWTSTFTPSPWAASMQSIAYGQDLFVAGGLATIQSSPDGAAWTPQTFDPQHDIHSVFYDGDQFLAGRIFGLVFASPNGTNWNLKGEMQASSIFQFARFADRWYSAAGHFQESTNLSHWEPREIGAYASSSAGGVYAVRAGHSHLVVAGEGGNILSSTDGLNFSQRRAGRPTPIGLLAWHRDRILATVASGQSVLDSQDGHSWSETAVAPGAFFARDAVSDGQRIIIVGSAPAGSTTLSQIRTSEDGTNWVARSFSHRGGLNGVAARPGLYAVVGASGVVFTSTNGTTWVSNSIPGNQTLSSIASDGSRFVVVGPARTNYLSLDGRTWMRVDSQAPTDLTAVAWGSGRFVAVGSAGTILLSTNGEVWRAVTAPIKANLRRVFFHSGTFYAVATSLVITSVDGEAWTLLPGTPPDLERLIGTPAGVFGASTTSIYRAGTEPVRLSLTQSSTGSFTLGIKSQVLDLLQVESSPDLASWEARQRITNTHGFSQITFPAPGTNEFYRITRQPR